MIKKTLDIFSDVLSMILKVLQKRTHHTETFKDIRQTQANDETNQNNFGDRIYFKVQKFQHNESPPSITQVRRINTHITTECNKWFLRLSVGCNFLVHQSSWGAKIQIFIISQTKISRCQVWES